MRHSARVILPAVAILLALGAAAADQKKPPKPPPAKVPVESAEEARYRACLAETDQDPAAALRAAREWRDKAGSLPARHCHAVALLRAGRALEAAGQLELLADATRDQPAAIRIGLLEQAAWAWIAVGDDERASEVLGAAIELNPRNIELYVDRAEVRVAQGDYWEAVDDLNRAIDLDPRHGEAFALRAAVYRYLGNLDLAFDDASRAVTLAPDLPDGWLERGIIHRLRGNLAGARTDWRQVLLLDAEGPAGDVARANIERMELKLDDRPADRPPGATRRR